MRTSLMGKLGIVNVVAFFLLAGGILAFATPSSQEHSVDTRECGSAVYWYRHTKGSEAWMRANLSDAVALCADFTQDQIEAAYERHLTYEQGKREAQDQTRSHITSAPRSST